jgi:gamma-glutamylcyclotransferase (GGCT)/AIG2-like uncharacterized protein YtfP
MAFQRLDSFEGSLYVRTKISVTTEDGKEVKGYTYVLRPASSHRLSDQKWSLDEFLTHHRKHFQKDYCGWNELK